ncbi:Ldh family oxidoreductase [Streptomyces sp. NPDC093085]|uniref:Ldh family oxidoreductase n=1 Tax=Streptomyces sp. NPDC093085 TaxID=3155068 RepID=UPI0034144EBB
MRVAITDLRKLMAAVCRAAGVPDQETSLVVEHYLTGELRGKTSHGVAKLCFEARFFHERQAPPEVVRERGVFAVIDAHREIGPLSATFAVRVALEKAARYGAGLVGMINTQRYGILASWTEEIARHGLIGIATNTSRAEAAVSGGRTPVLGVNPLSYALPTLDEPLSADMSTTLSPMGVLWECRRSGQPLPAGCFVDADGRPTDDPDRACSAVVFGEHRGFALSLLLQSLTGSLFAFPMGDEVGDTWTTGYTFIALDPSFAVPDGQTATANSRFTERLRRARDADGGMLRLPGERGRARAAAALADGAVDIPEQVLRRLRARAEGDLFSD